MGVRERRCLTRVRQRHVLVEAAFALELHADRGSGECFEDFRVGDTQARVHHLRGRQQRPAVALDIRDRGLRRRQRLQNRAGVARGGADVDGGGTLHRRGAEMHTKGAGRKASYHRVVGSAQGGSDVRRDAQRVRGGLCPDETHLRPCVHQRRDPALTAQPKVALAVERDIDPHQAVDALHQDTAKALKLQPGRAVFGWASLESQYDAGP